VPVNVLAAAVTVPLAPSAMLVPLTVTLLLVRLAFAMLDSVLLDPLIVLFVSVAVSLVVTARSPTYEQNTSFVPADSETSDPALDD
jgi:hypothetical protein